MIGGYDSRVVEKADDGIASLRPGCRWGAEACASCVFKRVVRLFALRARFEEERNN
jgi:hypothetical protein